MNEIKLSVSDKNLDALLGIVNNLKDGLISNIEVNGKVSARVTQYRPKANAIIREEDSGTNDSSGKYINVSAYKQRLKNKNNKKD